MIRMFIEIFASFRCAFRGILHTVRTERNFRIHLVAVFFVTWFAFLYEVSTGQAIVLVILYGLVLSLELINTAVENTVDLVTKEYAPLAKRAKDASAGGVLVSATASVAIAVLLFRDAAHWRIVLDKMSSPVRIVLFFLFVVAALFFVRGISEKKCNHD